MLYNSPVIKLFMHNKKCYVYDSGMNKILQITSDVFKELNKIGLSEYSKNSLLENNYDTVSLLLSKGYFKCKTVNNVSHHYNSVLDLLLNRFVQDLVLQVTQDCNFQCRYCLFANDTQVERSHKKINMSYLTAKKSVDYLFDHCMETKEVLIGFYGGEPFLNFELIQAITEYANNKFQSKDLKYITTTNGSLLNDEIIDFLIKNRFALSISLDGNEDYQNAHRKFRANGENTFNIVKRNVEKIKNRDIVYFNENVSFNPVIFNGESPDKVYSFFESIGVVKDNININTANLNGIDYWDSPTTLFSSNDVNSVRNDIKFNSFVKKLEDNSIIPDNWHPSGQCVPGVRRLYVTVDGSIYPCEKIVENKVFCLGNINVDGINKEKARAMLNSGTITQDECKKCWAFRFCEMCVSHCLNPDTNCLSKETKLLHCEFQKKTTLKMMKSYIDKNNI